MQKKPPMNPAEARDQQFPASACQPLLESLEPRLLMHRPYPWGGWGHLIGLDRVAATYSNLTGRGESIAVIDTGINWNHPAMGNGKLGYGAKVRAGWNFIDNSANYMDTDGHGTAVAGVLAADPFVFRYHRYEGIAPQAQLLALKVDDGVNDPPASRIRAALQWVIYYKYRYNIVSVNISEGTGLFSAKTNGSYSDLLQQLANMGVFVAAASGNDGSSTQVNYPGADPNVAAVGSVDFYDNISSFTDDGPAMDLLAPGEDVTTPSIDSNGNPDYIYGSGTSFSAPMAAGAAAIIHQANPTFSTKQILQTMQDTGVTDTDPESNLSFQRLDLFSALNSAVNSARRARNAVGR